MIQCLLNTRFTHIKYEVLVTRFLNGDRLPQDSGAQDALYVIVHFKTASTHEITQGE